MTTADEPAASLSASLLQPDHSAWDDARRSFNGTIDHQPASILSCATTQDVVGAVRYARSLGLPIAVRGGGHSVAGHGVASGAVVVSLDRMRGVAVDPERRIAHVEGGALWEDVDPASQAHGLAVPGGTFGDTGVGGLTLGGGVGWLLGIAGLTCDNLVSAEVVTADGEIVEAGPDGDPELLWALRGGGGNFGVVTRFDFRLTPVTSMYGGYLRYPIADAGAVLTRLLEVLDGGDPAFAPMITIGTNAESGVTRLTIGFGYPGSAEDAEAVIAPLRDLPLLADETGPRTYIELQEMSGRLPFGLRHYWKGHFLRELDTELMARLAAAIDAKPIPNAALLLESIVGAARQEPPDGAAFGQRGATWNATVLAIWESPEDDAAAIAWARETAESSRPGRSTVGATRTTPQPTRRASGSGPRSGPSDSRGWRRSSAATTRTTSSGST